MERERRGRREGEGVRQELGEEERAAQELEGSADKSPYNTGVGETLTMTQNPDATKRYA